MCTAGWSAARTHALNVCWYAVQAMLHAQQVTLELEDAARRMTAAEATTRLHQERSADLELRLQVHYISTTPPSFSIIYHTQSPRY